MVLVLENLGLVANGRWTDCAETVLWRIGPEEWQMNVTDDPRFQAALVKTVETIPSDVRDELAARLSVIESIPDDKVRRFIDRQREVHNYHYAGFPAEAKRTWTEPSLEEARRMFAHERYYELNDIFEMNWRFPDGWVSGDQRERMLQIFYDNLASRMRGAVVSELFPSTLF